MFRKALIFYRLMRLYAEVGLSRMTVQKAHRMLKYWLANHVFGKNIPWLIELSVTYRCQCRCEHCSVSDYLAEASCKHKDEMALDEIKKILDEAAESGIPKIDFSGGVPLLRQDIVELVRYGEHIGLHTSITTNALLLDEQMIDRLDEAGISRINISLDSVSGEEHDKLRGVSGIYQKAVEAIGLCRKRGIPCIASTYVTRDKAKTFGQIPDYSALTKIIRHAKKYGATGIRILFPIFSGKWADRKSDMELTSDEKNFIIEKIDPSFAFIEGANSVAKGRKVCQSLRGKIFNISPYGDIQLCIAIPTVFGNIRDKKLRELLNDMYNSPAYLKNKGGNCCGSNELEI